MKKIFYVVYMLLTFSAVFSQEYYKTYVKNDYVKENVFIKADVDSTMPAGFAVTKTILPQPVWPARQDVINCYWKAWEIAFRNILKPDKNNKFVASYIEPAFNNNIFMWDSGFMLMFGKYGIRAFNFQNTLNNFYCKQHPDGFISREIKEKDGRDNFERFDPASTRPNILPWTEWEYYLNFNDEGRLKKVFPPLLAYYQWLATYRTWQDGTYYSSGWGCGMDNQPRIPKGYSKAWSHGHMSWIDVTLQEIFSGRILLEIGKRINREYDVKYIVEKNNRLTELVNRSMWNDSTGYYFDRFRDGNLSKVKTIGAYWALLANIVDNNNAKRFINHLSDPKEFNRVHRVPTLSADDPDFNFETGGYWNGAVWAPTNYMVLRGLTNYKQDSLAYQIAVNHLNNVVEVFNKTGTLWENYSSEKIQGNDTKDFVGWTGLAPITVLFEYVFGIRPDVPDNTIIWDIRMCDEFGVKQYPFGKDGLVDFYCYKRDNPKTEPKISVKSNAAFRLKLIWEGGSKEIQVGKQ